MTGPQRFTIRRVTARHKALLDNVVAGVFDEEIDSERRDAWAKSSGHLMVVALLDTAVVGMCTAIIHRHADKATELYVDEIGVVEGYRREGLGRRMLDEMFRWGTERCCQEAWIATEPDNVAARGLYESLAPNEMDGCVFYTFTLVKDEKQTARSDGSGR